MSLGRIEDYEKNLPIVEIYTAVQSEGSRAGYPTVDVTLVKEDGVIVGILLYILKKVNLLSTILLQCMIRILIYQK